MPSEPKKIKAPKPIPLPYPYKGVSKGQPFSLPTQLDEAPPGVSLFCREALNVRSFDQFSDKLRGGPRAGTHKWHQYTVDAAPGEVQDLNSLIPFGSFNTNTYTSPDGPRALDVGGTTGVPAEVPIGLPWIPGLYGDGPWYVNPKKCDDDSLLDIWIEWGLLPFFLNAFDYNGNCYYANPFDKLIDDPPAILLPGDPLLGEVRKDDCTQCEEVPASCPVDAPARLRIRSFTQDLYYGDVKIYTNACNGPDLTYAAEAGWDGTLPTKTPGVCQWFSTGSRNYKFDGVNAWTVAAQVDLVAGVRWQLTQQFTRGANLSGTPSPFGQVRFGKTFGAYPMGLYSRTYTADSGNFQTVGCFVIRETIFVEEY